ncbi:MAG: hypothetical protein ACRCYU_03550 [Nocardioides sp.]
MPAVVAVLIVATVAAGCASARPGVAAQIGSVRVTLADVDEATANICTAFLPQIKDQNATYPLKVLSTFVVGSLTQQAIARQVADEYDLTLPADFEEQVASAEAAAEEVPAEVRDSYLELSKAGPYAVAIQQAAGRQALLAEGAAPASPDEEKAKGGEVFAKWVAEHAVAIDPRFGLEIADGEVVPADTSVAVPVSPAALAGAAEQMNQSVAAALPEPQRCN